MTNKKSSLWRFFFSLIPGAGEMYMGFLKMGVSLMSLFIAIIFIASSLHLGSLVVIDFIVWFYSFFHVHNLASLSDEEFYALEDHYLFCSIDPAMQQADFMKQNKKIIAAVLIFIGVVMTWESCLSILRNMIPWELYKQIAHFTYEIPKFCVGIVIIILGILMIRGKKKVLEEIDLKEKAHGEEQ